MPLSKQTLTAIACTLLVCAVLALGYAQYMKPDTPGRQAQNLAASSTDVDEATDSTTGGGFDEWDGNPASLGLPTYGEDEDSVPTTTTVVDGIPANAVAAVETTIVPPVVPSREDELRSEGLRLAAAYWQKILRKCADQWLYFQNAGGGTIYMNRAAPSIELVGWRYTPPKVISEADRLNGVDPQPVEFVGRVRASFPLSRTLRCPNGGIADCYTERWYSGAYEEVGVERSHGKWKINPASSALLFEPFDCSTLPAIHNAILTRNPRAAIYPS